MLDLEAVDLDDLVQALEDHSYEHSWWLDRQTGEVVLWSDWAKEQGELDPETRGLLPVDPLPSHEGYRDMEDFIAQVTDPRARESLGRAIEGRGAFRRFKDTLFDFPELREAWFKFHDVRMERRAIEWLDDNDLIEPAAAEQAIADRPDPDLPALAGPFDPDAIAQAAAAELRDLYGDRLRGVMLFGSWVRGDAHRDSDIDLLVILDRVDSPWAELKRMDDVLWRHSLENDTVISAFPLSEAELQRSRRPVVIRAREEGVKIA